MSRTIDSRVVEMHFDNKDFEKNVRTSLSTIENLNSSLDNLESANALKGLNKSLNNIDLSGLESGIEQINSRFSTLGIIGMTALATITNAAIKAGYTLVNSVISPIRDGGFNRALNLENARFQLNGILNDAKAVADVMNDVDYGVKDTAYSLDAAAKVAAQLAASGLRSGDQMRYVLRGISGVASMTNAAYEEIGDIYTNVAANGRLMGQDLSRLAARGLNAAAILGEALGKTEAEIRDMASKSQISFDTFAKAMDDAFGEHSKEANKTFEGAMRNMRSALARTGAMFAGPYLENMRDVFNAIRLSVNALNKELAPVAATAEKVMVKLKNVFVNSLLDPLSGNVRTEVVEIIRILIDIFTTLQTIGSTALKSISTAFKAVFSGVTANHVKLFAMNLEILALKLLSFARAIAPAVTIAFAALFKGISLFGQGIKVAISVLSPLIRLGDAIIHFLINLSVRFIEFIMGLDRVSSVGGKVVDLFSRIKSVLGTTIQVIIDKINALTYALNYFNFDRINFAKIFDIKSFQDFKNILTGAVEPIKGALTVFGNVIKTVAKILESMAPIFRAAANTIGTVLKNLSEGIKNVISNFKFDKDTFDITGIGLVIAGLFVFWQVLTRMYGKTVFALKKFVALISGVFGKTFFVLFTPLKDLAGILSGFKLAIFGVVDTLNAFTASLKAKAIKDIAIALAILAGAMILIASIDKDRLTGSLGAVVGLMITLMVALKALSAIPLRDLKGVFANLFSTFTYALQIGQMIAIASAILILAGALKTISTIDTDKLGNTFLTLAGTMTTFCLAMWFLSARVDKIAVASLTMISFSIAIRILASALKAISKIDTARLTESLKILAGVMGGMVASFILLSKFAPSMAVTSASMLAFAISIKILVGALKTISKIKDLDSDSIWTFALVLVGFVTSLAMLSGIQAKLAITSFSMIAFASAILILSVALSIISKSVQNAPLDTVVGFVAVLAGMIIAFQQLSMIQSKLAITSFSMIAFASAIFILAGAFKVISNALKDAPIDTMIGFAGLVVGMVVAFQQLSMIQAKLAVTSLSMIAFASAILILAVAMKVVSSSVKDAPLDTIFGFVIAVVGMVTAITMLSRIQGKLAITSFSMIAFASAIFILSTALRMISVALKESPERALWGFAIVIVAFVAAFAMLSRIQSKIIVTSFSMISFATAVVILASALKILSAIDADKLLGSSIFMLGFLGFLAILANSLAVAIPAMFAFAKASTVFAGAFFLITVSLKILSTIGPEALDNLFNALVKFIDIMPMVAEATIAWVDSLLTALVGSIESIARNIGLAIAGIIQGLADATLPISEATANLFIAILEGMAIYMPLVADKGMELIISLLDGMTLALSEHSEELSLAIINFLEQAAQFVLDIVNTIFSPVGLNAIKGICEGIYDSAAQIIDYILLGIWKAIAEALGLSEEWVNVGMQYMAGLGRGIIDNLRLPVEAAGGVGLKILAAMAEALGCHSPSFKGWLMGLFFDEGTANGIEDNAYLLEDAASDAGAGATAAMDAELTGYMATADARIAELRSKLNLAGQYNNAIQNQRPGKDYIYDLKGDKGWYKGESYGPQLPKKKSNAERFGGRNPREIEATGEAIRVLDEKTGKYVLKAKEADDATNAFGKSLANLGGGGGGGGGSARAAEDAVESLSNTIRNQISIFDEWQNKEAISADKMLSNMRSQIQGVTKWAENMRTLAARGIDQGLLESLAKMGPQGADKVAAFVSMTNEQLAEAGSLYQQSLVLPDSAAAYITGSFAEAGANVSQGFLNGFNGGAMVSAVGQTAVNMNSEFCGKLGIQSPSTVMFANGQNVMEGLKLGLNSKIDVLKIAIDKIGKELTTSFEKVGKQLMEGFAKGLENNAHIAEKAAAAAAKKAEKAAEDALVIESPSKLAERRLGKYFVMGFANGITKYAGEPINAASNMALSVADAVDSSMSYVNEILNSGIDLNPVITPRLDLGGMTSDMAAVNGMFENKRLSVSGINNSSKDGKESNNGPTFIQNNYSPKALSRIEIYRQTRRQLAMVRGV